MTRSQSSLLSWRFNHPDLDPGTAGLHLAPRGGIDLVADNQAIRQSILLLLSTRPGERLMRPEYGCYLQQLVFAPNNDNTAAIARLYVKNALLRFEPRIEIVRIDASRNPDPHYPSQLVITLEYRVRMTQSEETLVLSLDLAGG